jgi:hypothetical protein
VALEAGIPWDRPAPTEHGTEWIKIELDHPVNPWEHEGAGSITWGAQLDRLAPLGEEAVNIIKEAWEHRREDPREREKREQEESEPVDRRQSVSTSIKPGWATRVELSQYWIHLTLYQPINARWVEETGKDWSRGELINDGIVQRGVSVRGDYPPRSEGAADHRGAAQRPSVQRARAPGAPRLV